MRKLGLGASLYLAEPAEKDETKIKKTFLEEFWALLQQSRERKKTSNVKTQDINILVRG